MDYGNAQTQWEVCGGYHRFLLLRSIGASVETSWTLAERRWVALSHWAKIAMRRLVDKLKKEDEYLENFGFQLDNKIRQQVRKDNRKKKRLQRFPKKEEKNVQSKT